MIEQGAVLKNAFNAETFVFSGPLDDPKVARFGVVLERGGSGGGNALVHIHPRAQERFIVRSGRVKVVIAGKAHVVGQGEEVVVPAGVPHSFANANDGPTELTIEFAPAQQHLRFFANFASLAEKRPKWFSAKGEPHFLLIALALHSYRDHLYLAGPPILVQKLLFSLLAPIARLVGYVLEIEPERRL